MQITKDDITFILAVIGSLGTIFSLVSSFLVMRKNLRVTVSNAVYRKEFHILMISLTFENRSRLPIAITSVKVFSLNGELPVEKYPRCVNEYTHRHGKEVVDRKFQYNLEFPVDIAQLGAVSGSILLEISPKEFESLPTPLIVQVHSTRGRVQKIKLNLNQIKCV